MKEGRKLGKRHEHPPVKHRVFVATPAYEGKCDVDFAMSLAQSCMHAVHQDIGVMCQVMGNGAFIEMARNIFVKTFLETDCDLLFFIDSDLKWESRAFVGMVESGREVCAGAYRKRQEPEEYPLHYIEDEDKPGLSITDGGWVECDRVATGFLCIQRHVLEKMSAQAKKVYIEGEGEIPWIFETGFRESDGHLKFIGEDYSWCDKYIEEFGGPIYVWPDFDFEHAGYKCNWHKFMNAQVEAGGNVSFIRGETQEDTPKKALRNG